MHHPSYPMSRFGVFILMMATLITLPLVADMAGAAEPLSGKAIMARAAAHTGGKEGVARVYFKVMTPGQEDATLRYAMIWKRYETGPFGSKVMFFPEAPASLKGKAYMGFIARHGSGKRDEEWMYIPELLAVRKLTHKMHHHGPEDLFSRSVVSEAELSPRSPELDSHRLLETKQANGLTLYSVESTPKASDPEYPYARVITQIRADHYLPVSSTYLDGDGNVIKQVTTDWQQVNDVWVWKKLTATDIQTGAVTTVTQTDIKVNTGIKDRLFSERTIKKGPGRLF